MNNNDILVDEETIMSLADDMAAAAAAFSSHGYDVFIRSRDTLKETLHKYFVMQNRLA